MFDPKRSTLTQPARVAPRGRYLGAYSVTGSLHATLSNGEAVPVAAELTAQYKVASEATFRLTFKADTPGVTLQIRWSSSTMDMSGDPNLTVEAMALSLASH